ncbi:MAG: amidohydrolase [Pseudomonadales bacterium]
MKIFALLIAFTISLAGCSTEDQSSDGSSPTAASDAADTVYTNGNFYTVNTAQPWAEAVAVKDGKIIAIGSGADIEAMIGTETQIVDLGGRFAMPGVVDTHAHAMEGGGSNSLTWKLLSSADNPTWEEIDSSIRDGKEQLGEGKEWFVGYNMTKLAFPEGMYHKSYLDEVFGDMPAFIYIEGMHEALVNSKALELAGLTKDSPDPPAGALQRESDTGELTGALTESSAFDLVYNVIPVATPEERDAAYKRGLQMMTAAGVTAMMEAWSNDEELEIISAWVGNWDLPIHAKISIESIGYGTEDDALSGAETIANFNKYNVPQHMRFAKVRADGDLTGKTGYMNDPYGGGGTGELVLPAEVWKEKIRDLDASGLQIKIHAIGDGAVRASLDIFEELIEKRGGNDLRHHIDHINFVAEVDIARFAASGIPTSPLSILAQPWAFTMLQKELVGEERFENTLLPFGRLIATGAMVAYHSDWDASPVISPFYNAQLMVTRSIPGNEEQGSVPQDSDKLTVEQALRVLTLNGAYVMGLDDVTGSLEIGKYADMIVLDQNLFEIPSNDIAKTSVVQTIFKGEVVYERD